MKLGVIGDPVAQSSSPKMFMAVFAAMGMKASYEAFLVKVSELQIYVDRVRRDELHGFNVTIPHKQSIIPFLDELTPVASRIGAVNTVYHERGCALGHNTDGTGYLKSLEENFLVDLLKLRVSLLGAGGAALAIAHVLCEKGVPELNLLNRDRTRAEKLKKSLEQFYPGKNIRIFSWQDFSQALPATDLLIQTTPLGMQGKEDWSDLSFLKKLPATAIVSDIVANPLETRFLHEAKKCGLKTLAGHGMLLHQGIEAFEIFTGQKADVTVMREALLKALS